MSCCTSIKTLPCVNFCDSISTGLTATATGVHTLVLDSGNYYEQTFTIGNAITFTNVLNEDFTSVFKVKNPSGTVMTASGGEDCFSIKVRAGIEL